MDQLDVVRAFYQALNRRDADAVVDLYDPACMSESVFIGALDDVQQGRSAHRVQLEAYFERYAGGFEDGSCFRVRTIGGNETGWGWVQAEWVQRIRSHATGDTRQFTGYSHFLVEDGLIRRHRSVARETSADEAAAA